MGGGGQRGNSATRLPLTLLLVTSLPTSKLCPFRCRFPWGWACVLSRILWASPTDSPVRLGVSPTSTTPTGYYSQRVWGFTFPCWNPGLHGLSQSPFVPPCLSTHECGTAQNTSHHLGPLHTCCPSLPLLPVWMNVSLTLWLSDFHTFRFSATSGYFLLLNWWLSFLWLCEEPKYICLCLHLGWKLPRYSNYVL